MSQNVLVTGGTSGIGLATAKAFIKEGYSVAVCGRDEQRRLNATQQLEEAAAESSKGAADEPVRTFVLPCNLQDVAQCSQLPQQLESEFGAVDILINNAAYAPLCDFENTSLEDFEKVLSINLRATWTVTQALWKPMVQRGFGAIVNVSSMAAVDPFTGFSLYGASKGWLETWTKALADEGLRKGIRVYGVRPGAVETPLLRSLFPDFPAAECVSPEQVAKSVVDLVVYQTLPPGSIVTVASERDSGHPDGSASEPSA